MPEPSTLQLILANLRDAAAEFAGRFKPPADIKAAVTSLLADLGFADPEGIARDEIAELAKNWGAIADQLGDVSISGPDDIARLGDRAAAIEAAIGRITDLPGATIARVGGTASALARLFPRRLLDYVVYEALTRSHPKIASIFLMLAVLRRDAQSAAGDPALIDGALIRVFDLQQLIAVLTDPYGSLLKVLGWGTDKFNARPPLDGLGLLIKTLAPGEVTLGPDDDRLPLVSAGGADGEDRYVPVSGRGPLELSARLTVTVPTPGGTVTLSLVGLHKYGLGVAVPNPVNFNASAGSLSLPKLPASQVIALTPGADPKVPEVALFPKP